MFQGRWGSSSGVCVSINPHPFLTRNIQNTLPARALTISGKQAKFPDYLISGQAQLYLKDLKCKTEAFSKSEGSSMKFFFF